MEAKPLQLHRVEDEVTQRNFQALVDWVNQLSGVISGQIVEMALVVGDNIIHPPVKHAKGRITVYQDAVSSLIDSGLQADGTWIVNASVACNVRLLFF